MCYNGTISEEEKRLWSGKREGGERVPFRIIRDDITRVAADAIVNAANPRPVIGDGTDRAVYEAAGEERLLAARQAIGEIRPGQTAATGAFDLPAEYILHTVSSPWLDGKHGEEAILRSCYRTALTLAESLHCGSVAFPLLSAGAYGFPRELALETAVSEIRAFLEHSEMLVTLVVFDPASFALSAARLGEIEAFIDEHGVLSRTRREYGGVLNGPARRREAWRTDVRRPGPAPWDGRREARPSVDTAPADEAAAPSYACAAKPMEVDLQTTEAASSGLDEFLKARGESFQQRLFRLIDERGLDDVQVYKKANIDRKVFSRIRCKADYKPSKPTAVAFAIALELDLDTMTDLLARAEIALSPSSEFDLIITYFVTRRNYDIYEINEALFQYGQPLLGA